MSILAQPPGAVGRKQVSQVRLRNLGVAVSFLLVGTLVGGSWAAAAPFAALIWGLSAEAFIRKAALLTLGRERRIAALEVTSSAALALAVASVVVAPEHALALVGLGLVAKHGLEVMGAGRWQPALGEGTYRAGATWLSQVLALTVANVDFVIVGLLISEPAFAVYALAFRLSSAATSLLSYVVVRVSLVDMARAEDGGGRQRVYDSRFRLLFGGGVLAAVATMALAPLLPIALGHQWQPAVPVIAVLALALPWRMSLGVSGVLLLSHGEAPRLVRWEVIRLMVSVVVLCGAALVGFGLFVATVTMVCVLTSAFLNQRSARVSALRHPNPLTALAVPAVMVAAVLLASKVPAL